MLPIAMACVCVFIFGIAEEDSSDVAPRGASMSVLQHVARAKATCGSDFIASCKSFAISD
jgi:hypothetical protein